MTLLGGNKIDDSIIEAIKSVSDIYIDMKELMNETTNYLARLLNVEAVYITNSASSGIMFTLIATIIKSLNIKPEEFSFDSASKKYILTQKIQKSEFKYLIKLIGSDNLEYGNEVKVTEESLLEVINRYNNKIAAILHFQFDPLPGSLSLEKVSEIAHSYDIPVIVDAAAELPPKENLTKFLRQGADAVIFSGGKMLGSFSNSGLILGRKELIDLVKDIGPLSERYIYDSPKIFFGRPIKVSKEIIVGTVVAVEKFLEFDEQKWLKQLNYFNELIYNELKALDFIEVNIVYPKWYHPRPAIIPRIEIKLASKIMALKLKEMLMENFIPIYVYTDEEYIYINPQCLLKKDVEILTNALIKDLKLLYGKD